MKSLSVLGGLALAILLLFSVLVQAEDATFGSVGNGDILLDSRVVLLRARLGVTHKKQIKFPIVGETNSQVLTGIIVYDWGGTQNAGYVTLVNGGPNYKYSTILLESARGRGLHMQINYYGRRP